MLTRTPTATERSTARIWNKSPARGDSFGIAAFVSVAVTLVFVLSSAELRHWFVIPLCCYGAIVGRDIADWLRGRFDTFDPIGIIGILGAKTFVAIFLQVRLHHWLVHPDHPLDWRPWVGFMVILNCLGYVVYRFTAEAISRRPPRRTKAWVLSGVQFGPMLVFAVLLSAAVQVMVLIRYGGISGYMGAFESREGELSGMGLVFMFSECLPILLLFSCVYMLHNRKLSLDWMMIGGLLFAFFCFQLLCGGLRGSRTNTIWATFWALGIVHYWIRPVPKRVIVVGILAIIPFLYFYSFYKKYGREGLGAALVSAEERRWMAESPRGEGQWYSRFIGGGTTTFTLYRMCRAGSDYEYAWGRTYVGGVAKMVPRFVWPDRPVGKRKEGTDLMNGMGTYPNKRTSLVWGLSGEAMLNFGPLGVPLIYIIPGIFVGYLRRGMKIWPANDARWLMQPLFVLLCVMIITSDSDLIAFFLFKNGFLPFLVIFIGSTRRRRQLVPAK